MSNIDIFSAMQTGKPFKTYRKNILGGVYVEALDPFEDKPVGVILKGNPLNNEKGSFIHVWDARQDAFFRNRNHKQFQKGYLIEVPYEDTSKFSEEEEYNSKTDEELQVILNSKWLALMHSVEKFTEVSPLWRLHEMALDQGKSVKTVELIEKRLSEIDETYSPEGA